MNYNGNYPTLSTLEEERAPWNEEEPERIKIDATASYCLDFTIPVEIYENEDDCNTLQKEYKAQYPNIEDVFNYLNEHFKDPQNNIEKFIKLISDKVNITDEFVDFL